MRGLLAVMVLAGCYAPSPHAGAPCPDGVCPSGFVCSPATQTCERTAVDPPSDAASDDTPMTDAAADAGIDAPPPAFLYRRRITIVNNAQTALAAGFTIRVPLVPLLSALVGAGKVKADYSDLRVIGDAPIGERNRIVDGLAGPAPAALSFSLAQPIASSATNTSYYLYYGGTTASAAPANGAQVFALYDDFTTLGSFWLQNDGPSVSGGQLVLRAAHTDAITSVAATDNVPVVNALELVASVANPTSDPTTVPDGTFYYWWGFQRTGDFNSSAPWLKWIARSKGQIHGEQKSPVGCENGCTGPDAPQNTAARYYTIERDPTATRFYLDGALQYTIAVQNTDDYSVIIRNFQATSDVKVDWVRARARSAPDPFVTVGVEESL